MADVVIILGAGCSKDAGAPLMADFWSSIEWIVENRKAGELTEEFDLVTRAVGLLSRVHSKSQLDVENIESIFNAFEMAALFDKFPGLTSDEIAKLVPAVRSVITRTLELTMQFPKDEGYVVAPVSYRGFASGLKQLAQDKRKSVAVLTFNYDIGIDVALHRAELPFSYALEADTTPASGAIPLLKLHGSLGWNFENGNIQPMDFRRLLNTHFNDKRLTTVTRALIDPRLNAKKDLAAFIVPPTINKGEHHRQILPVWRRAARELGSAKYIFVSGYSLPPTDEFFRYLYAIGSEGLHLLRKFVVVDPAEITHSRFKALLGAGASQKFVPATDAFKALPKYLAENIK